ncbi:MAG: hypothetical protein IPI93_06170 [Sphingobacteriaceae bacterium]|nr:hypothetical protein [Sphingobacteriaceae bacterium]MBK7816352.1 hypothetical protein [Sphingobacteriaceae bacterium]
MEGPLVEGNKQGAWKFYDDSLGYLYKKQSFQNDYPHGEITEYYPNGVIKLKGEFNEKAVKHGKEYDKKTGAYVAFDKSLPVGKWIYYNESGSIIRKEFYNSKGKLLRTIKGEK